MCILVLIRMTHSTRFLSILLQSIGFITLVLLVGYVESRLVEFYYVTVVPYHSMNCLNLQIPKIMLYLVCSTSFCLAIFIVRWSKIIYFATCQHRFSLSTTTRAQQDKDCAHESGLSSRVSKFTSEDLLGLLVIDLQDTVTPPLVDLTGPYFDGKLSFTLGPSSVESESSMHYLRGTSDSASSSNYGSRVCSENGSTETENIPWRPLYFNYAIDHTSFVMRIVSEACSLVVRELIVSRNHGCKI